MADMNDYLEFAVASNFSFLRGASHPEELMLQAAHIGLSGIGLCDRNSVAGVVRAHLIKRERELTLAYHPGARLVFADGTPDILAYPRDRPGWGQLCRLLTRGNLRAKKGDCLLYLEDLLEHIDGLELIVMERSSADSDAKSLLLTPPSPRKRGEGMHGRGRLAAGLALQRFTPRGACAAGTPLRGEGGARGESRYLLDVLRETAPGRVRLAAMMLYRGNDSGRACPTCAART